MRGHFASQFYSHLMLGGLLFSISCAPKVDFGGDEPPDHCSNRSQDLDETDVDCGGSCDPCENGQGCLEADDCRIGSCVSGQCQAAHCLDGELSGDESDVDCGGACAPCELEQRCRRDADCVSDACDEVCVPGDCNDGKLNGDETDVDCGGAACDPCANDLVCERDEDCESGVCTAGTCRAASCDDGRKNGEETDLDCGGATCSPCGLLADCEKNGDCETALCSEGVCVDAGCLDGERNGSETDIDCGGPACGKCEDGAQCGDAEDCLSGVCSEGVCAEPACDDLVTNGAESDVDCGGACPACPDGAFCQSAEDCQSQVCESDVCQEPSCGDGVANQDESDVDCGGTCDACSTGEHCALPSDCDTGYCVVDVCAAAECTDGDLNGSETDVDCGGPLCPSCAAGKECSTGSDCRSQICNDEGTCAQPSCDDAFQNGEETDLNCGGPLCDPCGVGEGCVGPEDCESRSCTSNACAAPTCDDEILNGAETDTDCGGTSCDGCDDGKSCLLGSDCASLRCGLPYAQPNTCAAPACGDGVKNGSETDQDCGGDCPSLCGVGETCLRNNDCTTYFCDLDAEPPVCVVPGCGDTIENGQETDVDCGGPECAPCDRYSTCLLDRDCASGNCNESGVCDLADCNNGKRDGSESDVDCGGGECALCTGGERCNSASDCQSAVCTDAPDGPGTTCKDASCEDNVKNQGESDVDCGIVACGGCGTGQYCISAVNCTSLSCDTDGHECLAADCDDDIQNGEESDEDCGGSVCAACAVGQSCDDGADCVYDVCVNGKCTMHSCSDGVVNGNETGTNETTGLNCGGPDCADCPNGERCEGHNDCLSDYCEDGFCTEPNCFDDVENGTETDVDCGGPDCGLRCDTGEKCDQDSDCDSKVCEGGICQAASCVPADSVVNGNETDIDCGGNECPACADGRYCEVPSDCQSGVCPVETLTCSIPNCYDNVKNGDEIDTDCGAEACGGENKLCAVGQDCLGDEDCESGICGATNLCRTPGCDDNRVNQNETDIDCGGPTTCDRCEDGKLCLTGTDCESGYCNPDGRCSVPSCFDGYHNQDETDEDCGGAVCALRCGDDDSCRDSSDCVSNYCNPNDVCSTPHCSDTWQNGDETGVDCGGSCRATQPCGEGQGCAIHADCASSAPFCVEGACATSLNIAVVNYGTVGTGTNSTAFGHALQTQPDNYRAIVVGVAVNGNNPSVTVTYGGEAMIEAQSLWSNNRAWAGIYYLLDESIPDPDAIPTPEVAISAAGGFDVAADVVELSGISQVDPILDIQFGLGHDNCASDDPQDTVSVAADAAGSWAYDVAAGFGIGTTSPIGLDTVSDSRAFGELTSAMGWDQSLSPGDKLLGWDFETCNKSAHVVASFRRASVE